MIGTTTNVIMEKEVFPKYGGPGNIVVDVKINVLILKVLVDLGAT